MSKAKKMIIVPVILIIALIVFAYIYGWYKEKNTYSISEVFVIEILGTQGYGYANVSINPDFVEKTGIVPTDISYKVNKTSNLSNGDFIEISVDKPEGIRFDKYELDFQVDGLCKGTDLDIFKDLIIHYDAYTKMLVLDNSQCSEFIKENVIFTVKRQLDSYELGDVVEIIGYVDMNAAADNKYNVLSTSYEYKIQ